MEAEMGWWAYVVTPIVVALIAGGFQVWTATLKRRREEKDDAEE